MLTYFALAYVLVSVLAAFAAVLAKGRSAPPDVRTAEDIEQMRALYLDGRRRSRRSVGSSAGIRATHDPI